VKEENPTTKIRVYEAPWLAGMRAARANLLPGLILQGIMISLVFGFYFVPATFRVFDLLAQWKEQWGYAYSAISAIIAGAVIPEALRILLFQRGRITRRNAGNFLFAASFWGISGMEVDLFYRLQATWFGSEATFGVVVRKVLVDQFLYCPFLASPKTAFLYDWKQTGFSIARLRGFFTLDFYRRAVVPTLFATWGVWIPVVAALYSLPSHLQIPLFALALSLWVILFTWMSEQRAEAPA
jgi:hypothetical protein